MKKVLLGIALCVFLTGCEPTHYEDADSSYKLPPEMSDCKVFKLISESDRNLYVIRCPTQTTTSETHSCGKRCTENNDLTIKNY